MNVIGIAGQLSSGKDTASDRFCKLGWKKVAQADPMKRLATVVFGFSFSQLWGPSQNRNTVDRRFDYPAAWHEAEMVLHAWGRSWIREQILPFLDEDVAIQLDEEEMYGSLEAWFENLRYDYGPESTRHLSPRVMLQTLGTEWGRMVINDDVWSHVALAVSKVLVEEGCPGVVISDVRYPNELANIQERGGKAIRVRRPDTDNTATDTGVKGHSSETSLLTLSDEAFDVVIVNDSSLEDFLDKIDSLAEEWSENSVDTEGETA